MWIASLVLDPGSPFIELSTLAGYKFDVPDADRSVPTVQATVPMDGGHGADAPLPILRTEGRTIDA